MNKSNRIIIAACLVFFIGIFVLYLNYGKSKNIHPLPAATSHSSVPVRATVDPNSVEPKVNLNTKPVPAPQAPGHVDPAGPCDRCWTGDADCLASNKHFKMGVQYYNKDDYKRAKEEWQMSLKLNPNNCDSSLGLKRIEALGLLK